MAAAWLLLSCTCRSQSPLIMQSCTSLVYSRKQMGLLNVVRPRPQESVFKRKRSCFAPDTAIVHTATPKTITENGAIRKRSPEWSDLKRCFLKTLFSSVDRENIAIWKQWRHQNRHDRAPDHATVSIQNGGQTLQFRANFAGRYIEMRMRRVHLSMHTEGIKAFSKPIRRCSVDGWKRYENDKCGRKSFWKRSKTAPFSFENGLVWTGLNFAY